MGVGSKIKELRNKAGLTQNDLADQLHVTYQAVSRWENGDAEPSIDTLKEICRILNCSIEELFEMKISEEKESEEKVKIVEKVIIQEAKPVLGVCEHCNKPIFDASDLNRIDKHTRVRSGRTHHTVSKQVILCNECNEARIQEKKKQEEQMRIARAKSFRKVRVHSYVWPAIFSVIFVVLSVGAFIAGNVTGGLLYLLVGAMVYSFAATMILNNTFIPEMWLRIASWGFIRLPGVIFEFSFDGLIFLIIVKILFFIIGFIVSMLAIILATALAMTLSIFVYPFALSRNIKCMESI